MGGVYYPLNRMKNFFTSLFFVIVSMCRSNVLCLNPARQKTCVFRIYVQDDLFWIIFRKCVHRQMHAHDWRRKLWCIRGVNYNEIKEESFRLLSIFLRGVALHQTHDRIQNAYNGIFRLLMLYAENLLTRRAIAEIFQIIWWWWLPGLRHCQSQT